MHLNVLSLDSHLLTFILWIFYSLNGNFYSTECWGNYSFYVFYYLVRLLKLELDMLKFVLLEYSTAHDTTVVITVKQIKSQ